MSERPKSCACTFVDDTLIEECGYHSQKRRDAEQQQKLLKSKMLLPGTIDGCLAYIDGVCRVSHDVRFVPSQQVGSNDYHYRVTLSNVRLEPLKPEYSAVAHCYLQAIQQIVQQINTDIWDGD